jgi:hypothetical protein
MESNFNPNELHENLESLEGKITYNNKFNEGYNEGLVDSSSKTMEKGYQDGIKVIFNQNLKIK